MKKYFLFFLMFILFVSNSFALIIPLNHDVITEVYDNSEEEEVSTQINETSKFQEYLEYQKGKVLISTNINKLWLNIISIFQLLYELLILVLAIFSIVMMKYVFIELLPNTLMYIRDTILGFLITKKTRKNRNKRPKSKTKKNKKNNYQYVMIVPEKKRRKR